MADKKYLDQGGVSHLWDKVKAYLDNRFGTGTIRITTDKTFAIGTQTLSGQAGIVINDTTVHGLKVFGYNSKDSFKVQNSTSGTLFICTIYIDADDFKLKQGGVWIQPNETSTLIDAPFAVALVFW